MRLNEEEKLFLLALREEYFHYHKPMVQILKILRQIKASKINNSTWTLHK